ncbi:MAG: hypothetical protein OFPI_38650 [Osedax symbiont Rs2]|nr:MAG: hypothetical protein OFPI_38650 [Osedax symbiont Rs2]
MILFLSIQKYFLICVYLSTDSYFSAIIDVMAMKKNGGYTEKTSKRMIQYAWLYFNM